MKANGTTTVHYRLDESVLIQKLAAFLNVMHLQILNWMCPELPNENGGNRPLDEADLDKPNQPNQTDELGDDEPMHSAEFAQSITDSDSQIRQHNNDQDKQQDNDFAAVVETQNKREEILHSLEEFGISALRASSLTKQYGNTYLAEVIKHPKTQKCTNPSGYLIGALKDNWILSSKSERADYACGNGMAYITGKYAAFINH